MFSRKRKKVTEPAPYVYFPERQEQEMAAAIYNGNRDSVRLLINRGIDLNKPGSGGMTYLFYAMLMIDYDMVKLLLENGADPNVHSRFYRNPELHKKGKSNIIDKGVCLEFSGYGAFDIKFMKLLIEHGANVNDTAHISPLSTSCRVQKQSREKIRYLVEHGADINHGYTPIIGQQALSYDWDFVLFLMDLGADPMAGEDPRFNVANLLQRYFDRGFLETSENSIKAREVKRRLEQRGIKFPYKPELPKARETPDSTGQPTRNEQAER